MSAQFSLQPKRIDVVWLKTTIWLAQHVVTTGQLSTPSNITQICQMNLSYCPIPLSPVLFLHLFHNRISGISCTSSLWTRCLFNTRQNGKVLKEVCTGSTDGVSDGHAGNLDPAPNTPTQLCALSGWWPQICSITMYWKTKMACTITLLFNRIFCMQTYCKDTIFKLNSR